MVYCVVELDKYFVVVIIVCLVIAQTTDAREGNDFDNNVCYLDKNPNLTVAEGDRLVVTCSCFLTHLTQGERVHWTLGDTSLMQRIRTDDFRVKGERTDYDMMSTLTVMKVDRRISGQLCCTAANAYPECITVKVLPPTFVKVEITVKPLYRGKGNTSEKDSNWEVLVCCTVETDSLHVRDNAHFLPKIDGHRLWAPYSNTSKWERKKGLDTRYLKRHEFRMQLTSGSIVQCKLQDLVGMDFGPEGSNVSKFFPPVEFTPTSSIRSATYKTSESTESDGMSNPGSSVLNITALVSSLTTASICIILALIVLLLICRRRRRRGSTTVAPHVEDSRVQEKESTSALTTGLGTKEQLVIKNIDKNVVEIKDMLADREKQASDRVPDEEESVQEQQSETEH